MARHPTGSNLTPRHLIMSNRKARCSLMLNQMHMYAIVCYEMVRSLGTVYTREADQYREADQLNYLHCRVKYDI